jgi:hypothetical protein
MFCTPLKIKENLGGGKMNYIKKIRKIFPEIFLSEKKNLRIRREIIV